MKCPDCNTEMEKVNIFLDGTPCEPYWKCPKCKLECDDEGIFA